MGSREFVRAGAPLSVPVRELDEWLSENANHATPSATLKRAQELFNAPPKSYITKANWRIEKRRVYDSLLAIFLTRGDSRLGAELTRLSLIFGIIEALTAPVPSIHSADDVSDALQFRAVLIPSTILTLIPRRARLARRYGVADLYVVRDEWNRYEAGEIAHIENILPHETKKRELTQLTETEQTTSTTAYSSSTEEQDSQTTDRFEIQQHAQTETDLGVHVAAQVEVAGSYGAMQIAAKVGGSFDYSQKNAEEHAFRQSHEMVSRAVKRVEQRTTTAREARALQRITEVNGHALDNQSENRVVGIYRWVDKIQRVQLFRYPHRLLLEFQIPEPAAYLTWRRQQPRGDFLTPEPVALVRRDSTKNYEPMLDSEKKTAPLEVTDITKDTYQWWVAQYNVAGVEAPPSEQIQVSTFLELKDAVPGGSGGGGGSFGSSLTTDDSVVDKTYFDLITPGGSGATQPGITIPPGYRLDKWGAIGYVSSVIAFLSNSYNFTATPDIDVTVGLQGIRLTSQAAGGVRLDNLVDPPTFNWGRAPPRSWRLAGAVTVPAGQPVTDVVPVTARVTAAKECRVHVVLDCALVQGGVAILRWQQQTYELIAQAYWALKRQRVTEQAAQATGAGVEIKGDPPARNKEVIAEELKRGVIELLVGDTSNFKGRNAMKDVAEGAMPQVNIDRAAEVQEEIQFIEQAFEWENLTYVLYPYFWADQHRWNSMADVTLTDPDFARFLRSGSARVVVPARPKFESQVVAYVDFGALWGGGPVPTVNDPAYLSIAAEIQAQQSPPADGEKRQSWEVKLPTTLVWLDSDSSLPKVNPKPALEQPPGTAP